MHLPFKVSTTTSNFMIGVTAAASAGIYLHRGSDARSLGGRGVIQLGLLLLIATPIARVMFSVGGFLRQRNWMYVAVTLVVLLLLAYSLTSG